MADTKAMITAEQLAEAACGRRVELVRGELVEMAPVGRIHGHVVVLLASWLLAFVGPRKLGEVNTEVGFILSRNPDVVRAPDIAFVSAARLRDAEPEGFIDGAPDVAVEVLSPLDRVSDVQQKIREYFAAGARLVWLVDPRSQTVTAHHPSGDARGYSDAEDVPGEDVLPGFSFRPADLFRPSR